MVIFFLNERVLTVFHECHFFIFLSTAEFQARKPCIVMAKSLFAQIEDCAHVYDAWIHEFVFCIFIAIILKGFPAHEQNWCASPYFFCLFIFCIMLDFMG